MLQTDNQASTSPLSFLQAGCPSCHPTNSIRALKAQKMIFITINTRSVNVLTFWTLVENREEVNDYGCCIEDWQKPQAWLQLLSLHTKLLSTLTAYFQPLYFMGKKTNLRKLVFK